MINRNINGRSATCCHGSQEINSNKKQLQDAVIDQAFGAFYLFVYLFIYLFVCLPCLKSAIRLFPFSETVQLLQLMELRLNGDSERL